MFWEKVCSKNVCSLIQFIKDQLDVYKKYKIDIMLILIQFGYELATGCTNANLYTSFCSGGQKYASQLLFEGGLEILNSGIFTYDPWIWSKVTSLSSTASKRKGAKNQ